MQINGGYKRLYVLNSFKGFVRVLGGIGFESKVQMATWFTDRASAYAVMEEENLDFKLVKLEALCFGGVEMSTQPTEWL